MTSPIIFDGDRRSGSPMAGPKPQKRWLSIPIRIAARITVILEIWKKKQHQTYGTPGQTLADLTLSNGKNQHIYAKCSCYSWTCRGFEWFNSMFIYPLLFTAGVRLGWILDGTYRSRSSLLVVIAVGLHPHRRSKQKETDSKVPWTKVCLFGFGYHSSLYQNPTKSIQTDMDGGNYCKSFASLTKQNNASLCWSAP